MADERSSSPHTHSPSRIKVARSRASTLKASTPTNRTRADTASELHAPEPEDHHDMYTKARVEKSYEYAKARLEATRKPTPRTYLAYILHRRNCLEILHHGITEERQKKVRDFEQLIDHQSWLKLVLLPEVNSLMNELVALRWNQVLASVGDFVEIDCGELRAKAQQLQTEGAELFSGRHQWTSISTALKKETAIYYENKFSLDCSHKIPTYLAVQEACRAAALDFDRTVLCIHMYSERNEMFHNDIMEGIKASCFGMVAAIIYQTIQELYSIVPVPRLEEGLLLRRYFYNLRDEWFDCYNPDIPETWQAKNILKEMRDAYNDKSTKLSVAPTTPKRCSTAPGTPNPTAKSQYLETAMLPLDSYVLPRAEQMPPRPNRPKTRLVSENAKVGRDTKRLRASAWASILFKDEEIGNKDADMKKALKVFEEAKEAMHEARLDHQEKKKVVDDRARDFGDLLEDVRDRYGEEPPERELLNSEFDKLKVTGKKD